MFQRQSTALIVIDMQDKLLPHIYESEELKNKTMALIAAAGIMKIPILASEQYPEGLGPTSPSLKSILGDSPIISKRTFSCCREPNFMTALEKLQRRQILLCGIETHVCVFQTASDLIARGYRVQVAADAVSSRTAANKAVGLTRIEKTGGAISSVESALFELLETSACPEFKQVSKLIK